MASGGHLSALEMNSNRRQRWTCRTCLVGLSNNARHVRRRLMVSNCLTDWHLCFQISLEATWRPTASVLSQKSRHLQWPRSWRFPVNGEDAKRIASCTGLLQKQLMSQQSASSCPSSATREAKLARLRCLQPTLARLAPMVPSSSSLRLTAIEKAALP